MTMALNISETGRRAFLAGLKPKDNPFRIGSAARSLWARGYREAAADAKSNDEGPDPMRGVEFPFAENH